MVEKLNRVSEAWKHQFLDTQGGHCEGRCPQATPDIPLKWEVDSDGVAFLDGIWIAPLKQIARDKLDEAVEWVNPVVMEVPVKDGFLNIVIINQFGHFEITGIERSIISGKGL